MKAKALMGVVAAGTLVATSAHATPPSPPPALTVEVLARSVVPDRLNINTTFGDGTKIRLKTNGPLDLVTSRTTLAPNCLVFSTFTKGVCRGITIVAGMPRRVAW